MQKNLLKEGTKTIVLSFREFMVLLFRNKVCPICNAKLIRRNKGDLISKGWRQDQINAPCEFSVHYGEHYFITIMYYCTVCNKLYSLKDLLSSRDEN